MGKGRASSEIQWSLLLCEASFRGSTSQVWDIQKSFYSENFKYCVIQEDKIFSSKSYYKTASQRIQGTWLQPWHNTLLGQKYSLVSTFPNCLVMHCLSFRAIFCMKSGPQNNNHFRSFSNKVTFRKLTSMVDLVPVLICDYSIFPSEVLLGFYNPWPCFWTYRNENTAIILSDSWLSSTSKKAFQQ